MRTKTIPNEALLGEVRRLVAGGHTVTLRVKGVSMRPLLEDGRDRVVLGAAETFRRGDLLLAEIRPGQYVLHRLLRFGTDGRLVLLGDGNLTAETCRREDVAAKALRLERNGRMIRCRGGRWQAWFRLWTALRPARRYLLALYRKTNHLSI